MKPVRPLIVLIACALVFLLSQLMQLHGLLR
jgi:hypothetical protein